MQSGDHMKIKFPNSDRCNHCGHQACDDEVPFVIISKERFKWLVKAAQMAYDASGDDAWLDWADDHKKLLKKDQ
jgi:hypothetical protein